MLSYFGFGWPAMLINLASGAATDGVVTDTLISIENAIGSAFADRIVAGSGANVLEGQGGRDSERPQARRCA